jgi:hypothetical protein
MSPTLQFSSWVEPEFPLFRTDLQVIRRSSHNAQRSAFGPTGLILRSFVVGLSFPRGGLMKQRFGRGTIFFAHLKSDAAQ